MGNIMLTNDSTLYLSSIVYNYHQIDFWESLRNEVQDGGEFMLNLGKKYKPSRFVSRNGEWSLPWKQEVPPMFKMPTYDPTFSKSFDQVTDERALEIKQLINEKNQKFAVMFSGGIDSTLIMVALLKNLSVEELANIVVVANSHSLIENPNFWKKYIAGKFTLFDSSTTKYDDLIEKGYRPITGDEGDSIFGTMMGLELSQNYAFYLDNVSADSRSHLESIRNSVTDPDVHYSQYKDLIIQQFSLDNNTEFGRSWYDKCVKNINTATVPIVSLQDFYWWMIFNVKYVNCATRLGLMLNDRIHCKTVFEDYGVNWYNNDGYQLWSMVNNNNGNKIIKTGATYKMASRKYIHDFDKNDWYFFFKLKIGSLGPNVVWNQDVAGIPLDRRPNARFGLDSDYNTLYISDPDVQDFVRHHLSTFRRDW